MRFEESASTFRGIKRDQIPPETLTMVVHRVDEIVGPAVLPLLLLRQVRPLLHAQLLLLLFEVKQSGLEHFLKTIKTDTTTKNRGSVEALSTS